MINLLHFMSRKAQDTSPLIVSTSSGPFSTDSDISHGLATLTLSTAPGHPGTLLSHTEDISLLSLDSFYDLQHLLILSFLPFLEQDGLHLHSTARTTRLLPLHCFNAPSTKSHRNKKLQWKNTAMDGNWWLHIQRPQVIIAMVPLWQEETKSRLY